MKEFSKIGFVQVGRIGAVVVAGVLLTACQTNAEKEGEFSRQSSFLISDRYPIEVKKGEVRLKIPTGHGANFSSDREHEVRKFVDEFRNAGTGYLFITTPSAAGGRANAVAGKVARLASQYGVSSSKIRYRHYSGSSRGPVIVAYRRHFAVTKKCGDWSESMAVTYHNRPHPNFGCAQQHNIAAMAANPRDLETPRSSSGTHAGRIDDVFEKHRTGQSTASARGNNETGSVSDVK